MNKFVVQGGETTSSGVHWIWIPDLTLDTLCNLSKHVF